jgi:hypothetical protein
VINRLLTSERSGTTAGEEEIMPETTAVVNYDAPDTDPQYTEVRHYLLEDAVLDREFDGIVIAAISTEDPEQSRWVTMDLFRTTDGRYVYYRVGHSLVYHDAGGYTGACRSGVPTEPGELPSDAEPCQKCRPPLEPTVTVRLEEPLRAIFVCDDVPSVIQALVKVRNGATTLSRPAQRLLADAERHDTAFAGYRRVERL